MKRLFLWVLVCMVTAFCGCDIKKIEHKRVLYKDDVVHVYSSLVVSRGSSGNGVDKETQIMEIGGRSFENIIGLSPYYKKMGNEVFFMTYDASGTDRIRHMLHVYKQKEGEFLKYGPFVLSFQFDPASYDNVSINDKFIELRSRNPYRANYYKIDREKNTVVDSREDVKQ